jgi:hypothetical protein
VDHSGREKRYLRTNVNIGKTAISAV